MSLSFEFCYWNADTRYRPYELLHGTLYMFLLSSDIWAWLFGIGVVALQATVLYYFKFYEQDDLKNCAPECVWNNNEPDEKPVVEAQRFDGFEGYGVILASVIAFFFTMPDIALGYQLMVKSWRTNMPMGRRRWKIMFERLRQFRWPVEEDHTWARLRLFLAGFLVFGIACASLAIAISYTWAVSLSETDLLLNIVGILYILDVDEKSHDFFANQCPQWQSKIFDEIEDTYADYW